MCGTLSLTDTYISPSDFHDCHNIKNNDKVIIKSKNPYIKKGSSVQKSEKNFDSSIPFIKDNMSFKNQDFHSFSTNAVSLKAQGNFIRFCFFLPHSSDVDPYNLLCEYLDLKVIRGEARLGN